MTRESANTDVLALVLAGGKGSRLGALTRDTCKPALPFGGQYRVIDFTLSNCINSGIRHVGVLTQYQADPLIRHLQHAWNFLPAALGEFIEIWPAQQKLGDCWYRGTADAVYQNLDAIMRLRPKYVLVLAGDHVYQMDYREMLATHVTSGADVTVACSEVPVEDATRFGVVAVDRQRHVHGFDEKPRVAKGIPDRPDRALVSMGIYLFDTDTLIRELCQNATHPGAGHDFGHDVLPRLIATRTVVAHRFCDGAGKPLFWFDVGTLDAYHDAHMALLAPAAELDLHRADWAIRAATHNGRPMRVLDVGRYRSTLSNSIVCAGVQLAGATVSASALSENVVVGAGSVVTESVLLPDVTVGDHCTLDRVIVEAGAALPTGTTITAETARHISGCEVTANGITLVTRRASFPVAKVAARAEPHRIDGRKSISAAV
jgi:glucose-1-phosphate adenylyltransferase